MYKNPSLVHVTPPCGLVLVEDVSSKDQNLAQSKTFIRSTSKFSGKIWTSRVKPVELSANKSLELRQRFSNKDLPTTANLVKQDTLNNTFRGNENLKTFLKKITEPSKLQVFNIPPASRPIEDETSKRVDRQILQAPIQKKVSREKIYQATTAHTDIKDSVPPECLRDSSIARRWTCIEKIGSGSFGETYRAIDAATNEFVAIKVEPLKSKHPQLLHEARVLKILQHNEGFPKMYYLGTHGNEYVVLVMELLGPTLEDVFVRWANRSFSATITAMIGIQMIDRIEAIHAEGFLHRDIKPDNFLVGPMHAFDTVYMIDFGLSKRYRDPKTKAHIPYSDRRCLTGTARYVSVHVHMGIEPCRRDDLESCGYLMVYFLKEGRLPWQGIKAPARQDKYTKILEKKLSTSIEMLTKNLPQELFTFIKYCRKLEFEKTPDYEFLRKLLAMIIYRESSITSRIYSSSKVCDDGVPTCSADSNADVGVKQKTYNSRDCETTAETTAQKAKKRFGKDVVTISEVLMKLFRKGLLRTHMEKYQQIIFKNDNFDKGILTKQMAVKGSRESISSPHEKLHIQVSNQPMSGIRIKTEFKGKKDQKLKQQPFFCMGFGNTKVD